MVEKFEVGKEYISILCKCPCPCIKICIRINSDGTVFLADVYDGGDVDKEEDFHAYKEYTEPKKHKLEGVAIIIKTPFPAKEQARYSAMYILNNLKDAENFYKRIIKDYGAVGAVAILDLSKYNIEFTEGEGL